MSKSFVQVKFSDTYTHTHTNLNSPLLKSFLVNKYSNVVFGVTKLDLLTLTLCDNDNTSNDALEPL